MFVEQNCIWLDIVCLLIIDEIISTMTKTNTLFTLGPLLIGVGGIYTKHLCKTRDKMVEKHMTK